MNEVWRAGLTLAGMFLFLFVVVVLVTALFLGVAVWVEYVVGPVANSLGLR